LTGVLNNLAWVLADSPDPKELERALELIDEALKNGRAKPNYRGTRGRILLRLERWKEAVAYLEAALARAPDTSSTHQDLAKAYSRLGLQDLAAEHQSRATGSINEKSQP